MSKHKHNYTQYSSKNRIANQNAKTKTEPITKTPEVKMDSSPTVNLVEETVQTVALPKTVEGMVTGCAKLNVRAEANLFSDVVCTLNVQSEIEIDVEKSDKDWFYVCTASGIEGYCMRKYVEAHL